MFGSQVDAVDTTREDDPSELMRKIMEPFIYSIEVLKPNAIEFRTEIVNGESDGTVKRVDIFYCALVTCP
ncbi:unnamed protein product, partial [Brenthis ino]